MLPRNRFVLVLAAILLCVFSIHLLYGSRTGILGIPRIEEETDIEVPPSPNAFVFYATQDEYACSALVNIDRLVELFQTKHRVFVLVTEDVSLRYIELFQSYNATVVVETPPPLADNSVPYYRDVLLKLVAFKLHHYDPTVRRIVTLDSDQLVLQNLDHLFDSPETDLAAPRAYWIGKDALSSTLMLITLSDRLWGIIEEALNNIQHDTFDMDLINNLMGNLAMVLPGPYAAINSHWETWGIPTWYRPLPEDPNGWYSNDFSSDPSSEPHEKDATGKHPVKVQQPVSQDTNPILPTSPHPCTNITGIDPHPYDVPNLHSPGIPTPADDEDAIGDPTRHVTLYRAYEQAIVIHFFALGKPWSYVPAAVCKGRPDAHPLFFEQFFTWQRAAVRVCGNGQGR